MHSTQIIDLFIWLESLEYVFVYDSALVPAHKTVWGWIQEEKCSSRSLCSAHTWQSRSWTSTKKWSGMVEVFSV